MNWQLKYIFINRFPNDKFYTLPNSKSLQRTVSNLIEMAKFSRRVENNCRKRRNCSLRAISLFPTVFSKDLYCRHVKTRACLGKGERSLENLLFTKPFASSMIFYCEFHKSFSQKTKTNTCV